MVMSNEPRDFLPHNGSRHGSCCSHDAATSSYIHRLCNQRIPLLFASFNKAPPPPPPFFLPATRSSSPSKISSLGPKPSSTLSSLNAVYPLGRPRASSIPPAAFASEPEEERKKPSGIRRLVLFALACNTLALSFCVACGACLAADNSIRASGLGLKVAAALRKLGWADEAVVFALATLPVLELRGAIPVGYWMQLDPLVLTILSIIGNMVPVPIIILYSKKLASFVSQKSTAATRFVNRLFERAREKAGPIEEFQWLGLMLFVAVPFPGTGAWTGAIIASILDMPFWSGFSANLVGVILAGLLVNLLVNLGLKYAILTGVLLFVLSTVMWSVLRSFKRSVKSN